MGVDSMKDAEDEAFDELAKRQGMWGGGFQAKRQMAADKQEPAQEPVAWQWLGSAQFRKKIPKGADKTAWSPLYTTPPKRPWVGLTDAERIELSENIWGSELDYEHNKEIDFARAVEQLLKEKNT